jgi:NAD(P)-dependent dehydrogenase (short-subunit alcohol dehydrogenase family)
MRFNGKFAVVTGAAQGIGAAIAKRLYDEGASVALLDLNGDAAERAARAIEPLPKRVLSFSCNVADRTSVSVVFSEIVERFGRTDVLINNAGITRDAMFHKMEDDAWDAVISVNLTGVANCCKSVVPGMRERGYGRIVNLASVSAFGNMGQTNYGASKAGVIGFTKSLAKELARGNCTVNCIAPSYIDTDMLRAVPEKVMERFIASIPMGRLGTPEELAAVAAFLASDDSSFITGECIVVSGGSYM